MPKLRVGDTVMVRYTGYHRLGEDSNPAIITHIEQGGNPEVEPTSVELTVVGRGTVPFPVTGVKVFQQDTGEDRIAWIRPVAE